jgi:hypothetical protein
MKIYTTYTIKRKNQFQTLKLNKISFHGFRGDFFKKIAKEYINIQGYIGGEILKRAWE